MKGRLWTGRLMRLVDEENVCLTDLYNMWNGLCEELDSSGMLIACNVYESHGKDQVGLNNKELENTAGIIQPNPIRVLIN